VDGRVVARFKLNQQHCVAVSGTGAGCSNEP
jgi:hypothetical protein